jgi:hypothetical protein
MKRTTAIAAILLLSVNLFAQSNFFNPYPLSLQATQVLDHILITWKDSFSFRDGTFKILRLDEAISNNNIEEAQVIATVPYGISRYEDTPPEDGRYYYAVIGVTAQGEEYPQVAIYRNTLLDPVVFSAPVPQEEPETPAVVEEPEAPVSPAEDNSTDPPREDPETPAEIGFDTAAIVLTTSPGPNGLALEFQGNKSDRNYLLFRSTSIINTVEAVRNADLIRTFSLPTGAYFDEPPAGIPYYYAVVDASALNRGEGSLFSDNFTPESYSKRLAVVTSATDTESRRLPLPQIRIGRDVVSGSVRTPTGLVLPPEAPLSENGRESLAELAKNTRAAEVASLPSFALLSQEEGDFLAGSSRELRKVYDSFIVPKDYDQSIEAIKSLLANGLEKEWALRARFYLAQVYALAGKNRQALLEFISIEESFEDQSAPWIAALYPRLEF